MPNKSSSTTPSSPSNVTPDVIAKVVKAERRDFDLIKRNKWWLILVSILLIIFIIWRCPILNFVYRVTGINLSRDCKMTFSLKDLFNDLSRGGGPNNLMVSNSDGSYSSVTVDTDGNVITNNLPTPAFTSGPTGIPGADGVDGFNGSNGVAGPAGPQGSSGAQGNSGSNGTNGTNGSNGATGPIGPAGPAGPGAPVPAIPCVAGEYLSWDGVNFVCTATTNTLVNDGINTMTSTVNGVVDSDVIINTNTLTLGGGNLTSTVNGVGGSVALTTLFSNPDGGDLTNPGGELTITGGVGAVLGAGTTVGLTPCGAGQSYVYTAGVWTCTSALVNAQNGTSLVGNAVELGLNPLLHDTTVPQAGFDMTFTGGNFYDDVIGTTSGIEHGIQSASDIIGLAGFDGTIMYSSSNPSALPLGGDGSFIVTTTGQVIGGVQDGAGSQSNLLKSSTSYSLSSTDGPTSSNTNIFGVGTGVVINGSDGVTTDSASAQFNSVPGNITLQTSNSTADQTWLQLSSNGGPDVNLLSNNFASGASAVLSLNQTTNTNTLATDDGGSGVSNLTLQPAVGQTSIYTQNAANWNNLVLDAAFGMELETSQIPIGPATFHVSQSGDLTFDRELRPAGIPGNANDLLISQGVGVAPIWTDPATFLAANTTNTLTWTQGGGITSTVNGVIANVPLAAGTLTSVLGYDALGNPANESLATLQCDPTGTFFCQEGNSFGTRGILGTNDAFDQAFETAGVERMRITQTGRLLVSNTNGGVGTENVFLGNNVGNETLGGGGTNIGIGQDVLNVLTTGTLNIAIGSYTLDEATSGTNNIAIADSALTSLTTGGENIAIGHNALNGVTSGEFNIGIGPNALSGVVTSNNNTALGFDAGTGGSGSNNIFFGYRTGDAFSTGSTNILIGYDIDVPVAGNNNQLSIGNIIYGTEVDGTNTSLSTGSIGIGQPSPLARFHVGAGTVGVAGNDGFGLDGLIDGVLTTPALSTADNFRMYYEDTDDTVYCSTNGSAYTACFGSGFPLTAANNGLSVSGTTVQLGGNPLLFDTDIPSSGFDLTFDGAGAGGNFGIGGPAGPKKLSVYGDLLVTGVIDPTALLFSVQTPSSYDPTIGIGGAGYRIGITGTGTQLPIFVSPQANATDIFQIRNLAGTTFFDADSTNQRIGIKTITPNDALEVNDGNIRFTDNTDGTGTTGVFNYGANRFFHIGGSTTNTFLGINSGNFSLTGVNNTGIGNNAMTAVTTGYSNLAIGTGALDFNTAGYENLAIGLNALGNSSANRNLAIGAGSLAANTAGTLNFAIGFNSMLSNTLGNNNTAIGHFALDSNTLGGQNLAIGQAALGANVSGDFNLAIGDLALATNTASNNVAIGYQSLGNNSSGFHNIAVGRTALADNTTGNYNIAIGFQALNDNIAAHQNLAIGYTALSANTTGTRNLGLGYSALGLNMTGNDNLAIGASALDVNLASYNIAIGSNTLGENTVGDSNVAIGPNALLGVPASTTSSFNIAIGRDASRLNTTGDSNIAIGTNALYDNGSGNWNVAIGENALQNTTTNGSVAVGYSALSTTVGSFYNSAVGYLALRDTTVGNNSAFGAQALMSNSTGQYNSAMGAFSLDTNTTGSENTAMGYNSLTANIDGVGNSSFGYETMRSNSDGGYNVAVGFRPLYNNISGNLNIGIGYGALYANSVGNENTAIGANALYDNTGSFNAAFGSSALTNNVGGQYNTAVGNRSAFMNISGDENVALGYQALWGNDSGDRNVALGTGALYMAGLTPTAANNIAIGYQAGNNIASGGNNNIIIGYDIDAPVAAGANQLSLGNLIFGTGIDGTGTTISTGNIGIANSSPAYRLHVGSAAIVSGTTVARFENAGGTCDVTPNVAGGITCTSDLNSKRNISDFSGGLDLLASLQPKSFNMKADTEGSATQLGFIAQDVEQVIPGLVMTDANGKKSLSYIGLVPYTISAIKEQQIQFNSLSLDVEGLKADVTTLADNTGINLTNIEHQASSIEPKDSGLLGLISEAITNFFNSVSVAFNKTATFLSGAVFKGRVEFEDKDLAGYAVISAGASSVRVNYSTAYAQAPVVNVTAKQLSRNFAVTDESETGFTISLANTLDENSRFSWSAIAVKDAKTFNSDVSIVNDEPILTETPSKEAVQVPISSPTSTPSKESITPTESTPTVTVAPVTSEVINEPTPSETITTSSPGIE